MTLRGREVARDLDPSLNMSRTASNGPASAVQRIAAVVNFVESKDRRDPTTHGTNGFSRLYQDMSFLVEHGLPQLRYEILLLSGHRRAFPGVSTP